MMTSSAGRSRGSCFIVVLVREATGTFLEGGHEPWSLEEPSTRKTGNPSGMCHKLHQSRLYSSAVIMGCLLESVLSGEHCYSDARAPPFVSVALLLLQLYQDGEVV